MMRAIHLRRLFLILIGIIIILTISSILVCSTNSPCNHTIPTLNNLLNVILVAPYVITEINVIFWFHILVSACLYYMTHAHSPRWSRVQFISSLLIYFSIILTLFILPFTTWDNDYANYLIILSIIVWMISVILALQKSYRHIEGGKQWWVLWNITCCIVYIASSLVYMILRTFFSAELSGILAVEISSGLSFVLFLSVCVIHIWHLEFFIKI